ncbi:MAG: hypothetical protein M5U28_20935 [Sandaracinaceae bacterium]|nr:hypothetical protein [Sandaracinaceae bacterium]
MELAGYPHVEIGGRTCAIPVIRPERVQRSRIDAERARVVVLERADRDAVAPTSAARALAELHAGAFSPLRADLGRLARAPLYLWWEARSGRPICCSRW